MEIKKADIHQAAGLKVFMGASTGHMLVDDLDALDDIFNHSPLIVVTHCEDQKTVERNEQLFHEKYGDGVSPEHHHLIRDVESCYLSSSLAVNLAKKYDLDLIPFLLEGVALKPELNQDDGMHPNEKGTLIVSETLKKSIINFNKKIKKLF